MHTIPSPEPIRIDGAKAVDGLKSFHVPDGGGAIVFEPVEAITAGLRTGDAVFNFVKTALLWLARGFIAPCEVVLRRKFGERYFNGSVGFACLATLWAGTLGGYFTQEIAAKLFLVFAALSGLNALVCFNRDRKGQYWHSYSEGDSWLRLPSVDQFLARWFFTFDFSKVVIEPLVLIGASQTVRQFTETQEKVFRTLNGYRRIEWNPFANYLLAAGVVLFLYQLYCWSVRRERMLDLMDVSILAETRQIASTPAASRSITSHRGLAYLPRMSR